MSITNSIRDGFRGLFGCLLINVGPVVEVGEQDGVRRVEENGYSNGKRVHFTSLVLQQRLGGEVIQNDSGKHLGELYGSYGLGHPLGWGSSTGTDGVIRIHDGVDAVIDDAKPDAGGYRIRVTEPAVDEDGDVVVPVKDDQLLLPQNDKCCIE